MNKFVTDFLFVNKLSIAYTLSIITGICSFLIASVSMDSTIVGVSFYLGLIMTSCLISCFISKVFRVKSDSKINVWLSVSGVMFSILAVEVLLRMFGTFYTHSELNSYGRYFSTRKNEVRDSWFWLHKPNDSLVAPKPEFVFARSTNSFGLSDAEIDTSDKTTFTIIGIGDSFTEGTGVSADSTWLKKLESSLKTNLNKDVRVINAGIGGSDPVFEYILLEQKLIHFSPDLVIMTINSSDIWDIGLRGGFERFKSDGTTGLPTPRWEYFYKVSHVIRLLVHNVFGYNHDLLKQKYFDANKARFNGIINEVFMKLKNFSVEHGFKSIVVIQPLVYDFQSEIYKDDEMNAALHYLDSAGFSYLDLKGCISGEMNLKSKEASNLYWPVDGHFNQEGYDLFADCVLETVLAEVTDSLAVGN